MKYKSNLIDYLNEFKEDFSKQNGRLSIIDSNRDFTTECAFVRGYSFCLLFENADYEIPLYWFNLKYPKKEDFDNETGLLADSMKAFVLKDFYDILNEYFAFDFNDVLDTINDFRKKKNIIKLQEI